MNEPELVSVLLEIRERLKRIEERIEQEFLPESLCLTYPAAAARLGVGLTKLKGMVKSREIHTTKVGGMKMISVAELRRISKPPAERPRLQRQEARAAWVPIPIGKNRG